MHEERDGDARDEGEGGNLLAQGESNNPDDCWCSMDWHDCAAVSNRSHTLVFDNHGSRICADTIQYIQVL